MDHFAGLGTYSSVSDGFSNLVGKVKMTYSWANKGTHPTHVWLRLRRIIPSGYGTQRRGRQSLRWEVIQPASMSFGGEGQVMVSFIQRAATGR